MPSVRVRNDEPFDVILRRFRRSCEKAGIFSEIRKREYYEKPTSVRKRKAAAAVKREKKRMVRQRGFAPDPIRLLPYWMRKSGSTNCFCDSTASAFD